ncbi:MAG: hypothetical protein ACP5OG_06220 [Candidatus Nanoarchaeia archaeon]
MTTQRKNLEKRLEQLNEKVRVLKSQLKLYDTLNEEKHKSEYQRKIARSLPKVGKLVYVPKSEKLGSIFLDGNLIVSKGGLAQVVATSVNEYDNVTVLLQGNVDELRTFKKTYTWNKLLKQQEELKAKYGNKPAKLDENYYDQAIYDKKMVDLLDW